MPKVEKHSLDDLERVDNQLDSPMGSTAEMGPTSPFRELIRRSKVNNSK